MVISMDGLSLVLDLRKAAGYKEDVSQAKKDYAVKKYGHTVFADPENKKYPIGDPGHAKAAWSYINHAHNASRYVGSKLAAVKSRIKAALRKFGSTVSSDAMKKALEDDPMLAMDGHQHQGSMTPDDDDPPCLKCEELSPEEQDIYNGFDNDWDVDDADDADVAAYLDDLEKALSPAEKKVKPWHSDKGASKIKTAFKDWKAGKMHSGSKKGPVVTDHKQAIAIALSQGRQAMKKATGLDIVDMNAYELIPLEKAWPHTAEESGGTTKADTGSYTPQKGGEASGSRVSAGGSNGGGGGGGGSGTGSGSSGGTVPGTRAASTSMHTLGAQVNQGSAQSGVTHSFNPGTGYHTFASMEGKTSAKVTGPNSIRVQTGAHIPAVSAAGSKGAVTTPDRFVQAVQNHVIAQKAGAKTQSMGLAKHPLPTGKVPARAKAKPVDHGPGAPVTEGHGLSNPVRGFSKGRVGIGPDVTHHA